MHVSWCPTRRGVMSTIVDGSSTLSLWDVDKGGVPEPGAGGAVTLGSGSVIGSGATAGARATPSRGAGAPAAQSGDEPVCAAARICCSGDGEVAAGRSAGWVGWMEVQQ